MSFYIIYSTAGEVRNSTCPYVSVSVREIHRYINLIEGIGILKDCFFPSFIAIGFLCVIQCFSCIILSSMAAVVNLHSTTPSKKCQNFSEAR